MKCEVSQTNDVEKKTGICVFLDFMISHIKRNFMKFWMLGEKTLKLPRSPLIN